MCFRSLAELTIENPPTSSTFTVTGTELLLLLLPLLLLSPCFSLSSRAWVGRCSLVSIPRRLGWGAAGLRLRFFFVFFWVALLLLLLDDDELEPPKHFFDPYPSQSGIEIQPSSRYTLSGPAGMFEGRWPDLLHSLHSGRFFILSFRTIALAAKKGSILLRACPLYPSQSG